MASRRRRISSQDDVSVESILNTADSGQPLPSPSPHIGQSPNTAYFSLNLPSRPVVKHSRAMSYNPQRTNRLSFPVAPSTDSHDERMPTATSLTAASVPFAPAPVVPTPSPNDSSGFLVALAAQERRVLELKEELHKAEVDLKALKRQWAVHEAHKKKAEIRHVEPLQPLDKGRDGEDIANRRHSVELDRRKALLSNLNIPKVERRKFSGAHTRALSLLSPERSNFPTQPFPPVPERSESGLSSSSSMPDTSQGLSKVTTNRARHSYQGGVTHGAKQLAEDVKTGLWTFLEDLRQATVGEEAINGTAPKSQDLTSRRDSNISMKSDKIRTGRSPQAESPRTWETLTGNNSIIDASNSAWEGIQQTPVKTDKKSKSISLAPADDADDDWSNWDSPAPKSPRWSGSTAVSGAATPLSHSLDDAKIKIPSKENSSPKKEELQWPALEKLSAGNLKGNLQRTVSAVMKELEKSMTPDEESSDPLGSAEETLENPRGASTQEDVVMLSR